jgi:hypothetical protein
LAAHTKTKASKEAISNKLARDQQILEQGMHFIRHLVFLLTHSTF